MAILYLQIIILFIACDFWVQIIHISNHTIREVNLTILRNHLEPHIDSFNWKYLILNYFLFVEYLIINLGD